MSLKTFKPNLMDSMDGLTAKFHAMVVNDIGADLTNEQGIVVVSMVAGIVVGVMNRNLGFTEAKKLINTVFPFTKWKRSINDPAEPASTIVNDKGVSLANQYDVFSEHLALLHSTVDLLEHHETKVPKASYQLRQEYLRRIAQNNVFASVPGSNLDTLDVERDFATFEPNV